MYLFSAFNYLIRSTVGVLDLDVGLLDDAVEVFVKAVQQERHQLLRVLLLVAAKLLCEASDRHLSTRKEINLSKILTKATT